MAPSKGSACPLRTPEKRARKDPTGHPIPMLMTDAEARTFLPPRPDAQAAYQLSRDLGDTPLVALRTVQAVYGISP
jgi:hypothetical protein